MPPSRRRGAEVGQATIEHAAILLLVAALLGAAVLAADAASARTDIAGSVRRQMARALCMVGASQAFCNADRAACVVGSDGETWKGHVNIAWVHLGGDRGLLVERMSDGTFRIREANHLEGGLRASSGAKFSLSSGRTKMLLGGEAQASVLAHLGFGRSWTVDSEEQADAIVDDLSHLRSPAIAPTSSFNNKGLSTDADVTVGDRAISASLGISAKETNGSSVDHRTGAKTVYIAPSNGARASLRLAGIDGAASGDRDESYSVTFGRSGRATMLTVVETGTLQAGMTIAGRSSSSDRSGHGSEDHEAGRRAGAESSDGLPGVARAYTVETRLDLSGPADRALASSFIRQVTHPNVLDLGPAVTVSRELRRRLDTAGIATKEVHALQDGGFDVDAEGEFLKIPFGAGGGHVTSGSQLLTASAKGPDGSWYERADCIAAAAKA